jgi:anthranilate phosphoribosyltransferase
MALLNAAATIVVAGGADDLPAGLERARDAVGSGQASNVLERLVALSGELAPS